jgi:Na+-transporting methylmalonyl-CoA/oxaloacetate decarboxylase gamma subunit
MIFLLLLIGLIWLFSAKAAPRYPEETEKFISGFIVEYAQRYTRVITREEALVLIRAVWYVEGERILRELDEEQGEEKAQAMVAQVCSEAERLYGRNRI